MKLFSSPWNRNAIVPKNYYIQNLLLNEKKEFQNLGFFLHTQTSVQLPLLSNSTRLRLIILMPTRHEWLYAEEELWRYRLHHRPVHSWLHGPPVPQGPGRVRPLWSRQLWIGPVQLVPVKESNHISSKTVCFRWRLTKHCVKKFKLHFVCIGASEQGQ